MLSICIPIHNFDVRSLIEDLLSQGNKLAVPFELILIDDCSEERFKNINKFSCEKASYIELDKNIGRSKIRNLFLEYAQFENLLFLDCDSIICKSDFLEIYVQQILKGTYNVICGGRIYPEKCPARNKSLSWKYGSLIESKNEVERSNSHNNSFMSNNFMIKKVVFLKVKFDESIVTYGHEDTLFGIELDLRNVKVYHIYNPILNGDIELNHVFLLKTEESIINLNIIYKKHNYDNSFAKNVLLINFYLKLKSKKLIHIVDFFFYLCKYPIKFLLKQGLINLKLFNFYKLGFFSSIQKNQSK